MKFYEPALEYGQKFEIAEFNDRVTPFPTDVLLPEHLYHEDFGNVIWWVVPIMEPPWVGSMLDDDFEPDYYTHFSFLPQPTKIVLQEETEE